jgi:gliding motility-associated-like protein
MKKYLTVSFLFCVLVCVAQTPLTGSAKTYVPQCQLGAAKITANGGVPPYSFTWNNGALGDSVSSLNGGSYVVHIKDSDTSEVDVSFDISAYVCKVYIANKFSPNGDGINDFWTISRTEDYPNFLVQVFDRWGQIVHQQRKTFVPWDGTHLGIKLADATYYVVFFYDENKPNNFEKSNVTLVR